MWVLGLEVKDKMEGSGKRYRTRLSEFSERLEKIKERR
jgi:hypothetical protein